jgi:Holliday junction resolvasome RuvABC endonuclease subunit
LRLITLDLATSTGYTDGDAGGEFLFGTFTIPARERENLGGKAIDFERWLVRFFEQGQPVKLVVFEQPILPAKSDIRVVRLLHGLAFLVELECWRHRVECVEQNLMPVKKFWTGDGWASKDKMIEAAQQRGLAPANSHEADAIALRMMTLEVRWPRLARKLSKGPLGI